MALPNFNNQGELPEGVHSATIDEVIARFGVGTAERQAATAKLLEIYHIATSTGKLDRLVIFGSYVTTKPVPNDIDVVLILSDDFDLTTCDEETRLLFDHQKAADEFGASVFWIRPAMLILETLDEFIAYWQVKRDKTRRGIIEVKS
ncbi:hypothetical protein HUU40_25625 [candidate division KSB1 bacterium]|nr:hypothetical protein [candidate division KSB1 bacterium]